MKLMRSTGDSRSVLALFLSILALLTSSIAAVAQQNFQISGQIGKIGAPAKIFLTYNNGGTQVADSAEMKNGTFSFTGQTDLITYATLVLDYKGVGLKNLNNKSKIDVTSIYLVNGTTYVKSADSLSTAVISGTKINVDGQRYAKALKSVNDRIVTLNRAYENAKPEKQASESFVDSLRAKYDIYQEERTAINKKFIKENPDSFISFMALYSLAGPNPEGAEIEAIFNSLAPAIKQSKEAEGFRNALENGKKTAIGATAIDFTQNDTKGQPVTLSSFRGKYVLLDFWASWCGPCRQENPNVVLAYNLFKDKNFTVLGVSLDRENGKDAWLRAIENDKLTWTHVSDLKFWNNEVAVKYGIRSIPQNFLIDPDGKIIAKNLRGEELQNFLSQLLGGK